MCAEDKAAPGASWPSMKISAARRRLLRYDLDGIYIVKNAADLVFFWERLELTELATRRRVGGSVVLVYPVCNPARLRVDSGQRRWLVIVTAPQGVEGRHEAPHVVFPGLFRVPVALTFDRHAAELREQMRLHLSHQSRMLGVSEDTANLGVVQRIGVANCGRVLADGAHGSCRLASGNKPSSCRRDARRTSDSGVLLKVSGPIENNGEAAPIVRRRLTQPFGPRIEGVVAFEACPPALDHGHVVGDGLGAL